jgi:uncharacterized protein (DUF58 family)
VITRYGWLLLLAAAAIGVVARLFGVLELYVVAAGLVALVLFSFVLVRFGRVQLRVARRVSPNRVHVDEPARVELAVRNSGRRTTPVLRLTDPVSGTPGASLSISPIRPGTGSRAAYRLPTNRRGRVQIGPMLLERRDPFGLAARAVRAASSTEILVYPAWQRLPFPGHGAGVGQLSEHLRLRALGRHGEEFHALREYVPGDDLRRIHWKQSARTDEFKVKQTDTRAVRRIGVVFDVAAQRHTPASFERAVSATASFVISAAETGYSVRAALSATNAAATVDVEACLDELALVMPGQGRSLVNTVQDVARWLDGGALVVVTGRAGDEAVSAARAATPGADAGVLVVCEPPVPAIPGIFVVDGTSAQALAMSWGRLVGSPTRQGTAAAPRPAASPVDPPVVVTR